MEGSGYWAALHIRSPRKGFGPVIHPDDVARVLDVGGTGLLGQYIGQEGLRRGHEGIAAHRGRHAPGDKRIDRHPLGIPDSVILRLSSVFGWNRLSSKTNAVTWILQKLEEGQEVPLFQDQKVTPSYAKTAAEVAFDLWGRHASGLFHVSCPDCASRVEMGRAVADVFQVSNPKLTSIPLASVALRANRPLAPCLVVRKVEETLKRPMPTFRACLEDMKATR